MRNDEVVPMRRSLTTQDLAEQLTVSDTWVLNHKRRLMGMKETRPGRRKQWWFPEAAVEVGRAMLEGKRHTIINECESCGRQTVHVKGRLKAVTVRWPSCFMCEEEA